MAKVTTTTKVTAVTTSTATVALDGTNLPTLVESLNDTKKALKALEAQEKAIRAEILELMGEAEEATIGGIVQVELREQTRTDIDREALKLAYPEAWEACQTSTTYKVLRTK